MKRVLIVEDVLETRVWLAEIVQHAFPDSKTDTAANLAKARDCIATNRYDLALLDLGLPDGNGLELLTPLRRVSPDVIAVVATVSGDDASVVAALSAGVQGYLLKDHEAAVLSLQLQQVAMGVPALSPAIAQRIMRHFQATGPVMPDANLTQREKQVLDLIALGLRNAEVAKELNIAESTVSWYIKAIYAKLGISSRAEAAVYARRLTE